MQGYKDLVAWQKSMELVAEIYEATKCFPSDEMYGLRSQLRRAAVSVPSNLAEGHGRNNTGEFHQFIGQARGSLCEVETQLEIAKMLGFLNKSVADELQRKVGAIGRMLTGLRTWSARTRTNS
jgi:four helix bundle protein